MVPPMKILHAPTNIGGNPAGLARAERALGLDSRAVTLNESPFAMAVDKVVWPPGIGLSERIRRQFRLIRDAAYNYDAIHYNFGRTISFVLPPPQKTLQGKTPSWLVKGYNRYAYVLQRYELALIRRTKVPVFVTYQGDDARQDDYCARHFEISVVNEPDGAADPPAVCQFKRDQIRLLAGVANKIYALNPDLLHVLPNNAQFMPYASIDIDKWVPVNFDKALPLVVHAPTNRRTKGTRYILQAVEELRAAGAQFDFKLIENMSHEKARETYEQADLLIDQLLVGWYGGLAVEHMALGKPVICYLREDDLKFIPARMRAQMPIIQASPASIKSVLAKWLETPLAKWRERGAAGRSYVEAWHNPSIIAAQLKSDYEAAAETANTSRPLNSGARR